MLTPVRRFRKYLANTSWILSDKLAGLAMTFVVSIFVARYFGPERFGIFSYALSIMSLFAVAGHMGLSGIVVRELVKHPGNSAQILGTVLLLKIAGYGAAVTCIVVLALTSEDIGSEGFWVVVIVGSSLLLRPWDVVEFWFQSKVQAKYGAIANLVSRVGSAVMKIAIVALGAGIVLLAFAQFAQGLILTAALLYFYIRKSDIPLCSWKFDRVDAKRLLAQGAMVFAGSAFAVVNLKVDQIMIRWMVGPDEVGYYAIAATLSEAWYFVPMAIVTSIFPRLIQLRTSDPALYMLRLQQTLDLLFTMAAAVAVAVSLLAQPVIKWFYGDAYEASVPILQVHVWAGVFVFMRMLFSRWILIENLLLFSLLTNGFGAASNIVLNLILIPRFGGFGAALATLISYAISSYVSLLVLRESRGMFWMMSRAFVAPIRYPLRALRQAIQAG